VAADGSLTQEKGVICRSLPILRLLKKVIDTSQCSRVVMAAKLTHSSLVLRRLLYRQAN